MGLLQEESHKHAGVSFVSTNRKSRSELLRKILYYFRLFSCSKLKRSVVVTIVLCLGMGCATDDLFVTQVYSGDRKPQDETAILIVKGSIAVVELNGHDWGTFNWYSYGVDVLELKPGQYTAKLEYRTPGAVGAPVTVSLNTRGGHVYLLKPVKNWQARTWSPELKDITDTSEGAKYLGDVDKCKRRKVQSLE